MCGFLGKVSLNNKKHESIFSSNKYLVCRGPDNLNTNKGIFSEKFLNDDINYFEFVFNRLSILDLNDNANQPMVSDDFKTIVMFNGEIYNTNELRKELEKQNVSFKTSHSDTEVVLIGLSIYGKDFIKKLRGQFSIAFYDSNIKKLMLIRDRVGQKPLFYHEDEEQVLFSSNLLSVATLIKSPQISEQGFSEYINYGVVPSPNTIFKDIKKVSPGEVIEFNLSRKPIITKKNIYWQIENYIGNEKFDATEFFKLFDESTSIRNMADVDIAYFLSGGIDSTSIIESVRKEENKINTFSVIYDDKKYDEREYIESVSKEFNTSQNFEQINLNNINEYLVDAAQSLDEPYSDPSIVPTYIISKLISKKYKVAISGDGGDELTGGYLRFQQCLKRNTKLSFFQHIYKIYPAIFGTGNNLLKYHNRAETSYASFLSDHKFLKLLKLKNSNSLEKKFFIKDSKEENALLIADYKFFLSEMMMLKVDRMSMANSLEVRSPFVDHKLIEYVLSHDKNYMHQEDTKLILKKRLKNYFDNSFLNRKKMGFVFNIKKWVYTNLDLIITDIESFKFLDINFKKIIKKLSIVKSRTNALRIWKLYVFVKYINNLKDDGIII